MITALLREFEDEAGTTRRVLERVPSDKLAWKPHPKSMSLGVLALHVAASPGVICGWAEQEVTEFKGDPTPTPASTEEILAAHDRSVATSKDILGKLGDEGLKGMWSAKAGDNTLMTMPKAALVRMSPWRYRRVPEVRTVPRTRGYFFGAALYTASVTGSNHLTSPS